MVGRPRTVFLKIVFFVGMVSSHRHSSRSAVGSRLRLLGRFGSDFCRFTYFDAFFVLQSIVLHIIHIQGMARVRYISTYDNYDARTAID